MIVIRGGRSTIAERLIPLLPKDETVVLAKRKTDLAVDADRYLFCQGLLQTKPQSEQSRNEIEESWTVNCWYICDQCERILRANDAARICIMGSDSGFSGSFDGTYAESKAAIHKYIDTKKLRPNQQLVGIAPSIIADSGMTTRRLDFDNLKRRLHSHPKKRFLMAEEVARLVHFCLYVDGGYITNTVIRMNGGMHIC